MQRSVLIKAHLWVAAFFAPALVLAAVSGGLYLLGYKGATEQTPIATLNGVTLDVASSRLKADVVALLNQQGLDPDFEYVKVSGRNLFTRPTSAPHYQLTLSATAVDIFFIEPDLQKSLIELHKGHGPLLFKTYQQILALALLLVVCSGTWLGISSGMLRRSTLTLTGAGFAVLLALVI